jgi:putative SOS response-associated peptidase YedK
MCGRFTVAEPDANAFSFRFGFSYSDFENFDWKPNYNARAETVQTSGAFKNALKRRRCLIIADSFYEWKKTDGTKIPMRIGLKDWELFAFAGLWESWTNKETGVNLHSCTVITCPPNELVSPIHDRMPVILPKEAEVSWLAPTDDVEAIQSLLVPYNADAMTSYAVSNLVNSVKNSNLELLTAV